MSRLLILGPDRDIGPDELSRLQLRLETSLEPALHDCPMVVVVNDKPEDTWKRLQAAVRARGERPGTRVAVLTWLPESEALAEFLRNGGLASIGSPPETPAQLAALLETRAEGGGALTFEYQV